MHLDRMKTLSFISALTLTLAYGCSSKNNGDDDMGVGGGYNAGTGGAGASLGGGASVGGSTEIDPNYCQGMLSNANCGATRLEADVRTVNMMLVLDQSGSMGKSVSGATTDPPKWSEMKSALSGAMKAVAADINFGLILYPYSGDVTAPGIVFDPNGNPPADVTCQVPQNPDDPNAAVAVGIEDGVDKLNEILTVVGRSTPAGGTPTAVALNQAFRYFTEGGGSTLKGSKWVLLATDGGPNCNQQLTCKAETCTQNIDCSCAGNTCSMATNCCDSTGNVNNGYICLDDVEVTAQITKLAQSQIKTFVVGIPGTESYANTLNKMAIAGKMENTAGVNGEAYYAVSATDSLKALQDTFSTITTQLVKSCDVELQETPPSPDRVIVAMDCQKLPLVPADTPDTGGADGFYIDYNQAPAHLRLTGRYCDQISTLGAKNLDVITGCQIVN